MKHKHGPEQPERALGEGRLPEVGAKGVGPHVEAAAATAGRELALLQRGFEGSSIGRQAWGMLPHTQFALSPRRMQDLSEQLKTSKGTLERRLARGDELFAAVLGPEELAAAVEKIRPHKSPAAVTPGGALVGGAHASRRHW